MVRGRRQTWCDCSLARTICPDGASAITTPAGIWRSTASRRARVDGASYWRIFLQVVLPLCRPVLATLGIFTFLGSWNEFLWPLVMISSIQNKTLPLGLTMFQAQAAIKTPWHLVMAAATFSVIPVLLLFVLGQRYYVRGIATTGVKG